MQRDSIQPHSAALSALASFAPDRPVELRRRQPSRNSLGMGAIMGAITSLAKGHLVCDTACALVAGRLAETFGNFGHPLVPSDLTHQTITCTWL